MDRYARARTLPDFLAHRVEQRHDFESLVTKSRIVRQRETEVPGPHDGDGDATVESEDLTEMPAQFLDVIADASHSELTKVGEVLSDLRCVQVKLLGQGL